MNKHTQVSAMDNQTSKVQEYERMNLNDLRRAAVLASNPYDEAAATTTILQKSMLEDTPRLTVSAVRPYIVHIASEDDDESQYGRKQLSQRLGGVFRSFVICSDDHKDDLFHIPSVYMPFSTSDQTENPEGISMTTTFKTLNDSQFAGFAAKREEALDDVGMLMGKTFKQQDPVSNFYGGWYEIFDFFNLLSEPEHIAYEVKRQEQLQNNHHFYWMKRDENMWDYIKRTQGRDPHIYSGNVFTVVADSKTTSNPVDNTPTTQEQSKGATIVNEQVETDDWE